MHTLIFFLLHSITAQQASTAYVNMLEPLLQRNRDAYLSGPHTAGRRREALASFDSWWVWLHSPESCGNPMMDDAGTACLSERERSGQWPWEKYYRDPIIAAKPEGADVPTSRGSVSNQASTNR